MQKINNILKILIILFIILIIKFPVHVFAISNWTKYFGNPIITKGLPNQ